MTLNKLFKNTTYDDTLFSAEAKSAIESRSFMKTVRGAEVPYITCAIRNKDIKLTPEEAVRQLYIYKLMNVFKPHTGTKTSVLFVQKWDDELCPKKEDYPIFFATMQKPSKDNSGDKIYVKDPATGENILDSHGHLIVDHDLYSHDGLTPDGIAEAFIEFAKKEGLSFFR